MLMYRKRVFVWGKRSASLQLLSLFRLINKHLIFNYDSVYSSLFSCHVYLSACLSVQAVFLPLSSTPTLWPGLQLGAGRYMSRRWANRRVQKVFNRMMETVTQYYKPFENLYIAYLTSTMCSTLKCGRRWKEVLKIHPGCLVALLPR